MPSLITGDSIWCQWCGCEVLKVSRHRITMACSDCVLSAAVSFVSIHDFD